VDIFRKPKEKIAHWLLTKKQRNLHRAKEVHNFDTARNIGVIFSLEKEESFDVTNQFLNFLAGKKIKVYALGYVPQKEIPPKLAPNSKINLFTRKDLNWYYMPTHPIVNQFTEQEFDILIDLSDYTLWPLKFVNNLSRARFKVGKEANDGKNYDMMLKIGEDQDLQYFIEQIKYYLSRINKKQ